MSLDGDWTVISSRGMPEDGHVFIDKVGKKITISADVMTFQGWDDSKKQLTIIVDRDPQQIDLTQVPDAKGWSRLGIFQLNNDQLILCLNFPGLPRPSDFKEVADGREIVKLIRNKP